MRHRAASPRRSLLDAARSCQAGLYGCMVASAISGRQGTIGAERSAGGTAAGGSGMNPSGTEQRSRLLAGKHALVTGGSRGIGAAVTRALLAHGARVTMLGRDEKTLAEAARAAVEFSELSYTVADISDANAVRHSFHAACGRFGRIDILVNNAGQASSAPFLKTDWELWRRMLAVNLDGTFHCTQAALPGMLEAGWGRGVNLGRSG